MQFLLAVSAKDFHDHQPPTPANFRSVRFGHIAGPDRTKQPLLSGEFFPAGEKGEWTPFATIKTSGYEQLVGAQAKAYSEQPTITWETGDLSAFLKNQLDSLR